MATYLPPPAFAHSSPKNYIYYPLPFPDVLFGLPTPQIVYSNGVVPPPVVYLPPSVSERRFQVVPDLSPRPLLPLTAPIPQALAPRVPELPPIPITTYPEMPVQPEAFEEALLPISEIITPKPYRSDGKYAATNPGNYTGMYQTVNAPTFQFPKTLTQ